MSGGLPDAAAIRAADPFGRDWLPDDATAVLSDGEVNPRHVGLCLGAIDAMEQLIREERVYRRRAISQDAHHVAFAGNHPDDPGPKVIHAVTDSSTRTLALHQNRDCIGHFALATARLDGGTPFDPDPSDDASARDAALRMCALMRRTAMLARVKTPDDPAWMRLMGASIRLHQDRNAPITLHAPTPWAPMRAGEAAAPIETLGRRRAALWGGMPIIECNIEGDGGAPAMHLSACVAYMDDDMISDTSPMEIMRLMACVPEDRGE